MDVYQRRRLIALSAVAASFIVLVLLIRSCGGDDQSSTALTSALPGTTGAGGATPLSQDDFVSQGDAICRESNTALASVDASDANQAASDRAELLAGELNSLQSLSLAPGEKGDKKLANFLAALQKQVQAYDERSLAVERSDDNSVSQIDATIADAAAEAKRAAKRFGFEACGDTSQVSSSSGGGSSGGAAATTTTAAPTTPVTPTTTTPTTPPDTGGGATPPGGGTGDDGGSSSGSGGLTP
jgi:hypothetical protein